MRLKRRPTSSDGFEYVAKKMENKGTWRGLKSSTSNFGNRKEHAILRAFHN